MLPFFKTCAIFFIFYKDAPKIESIDYCVIKCLPILSLIAFIVFHGIGFADYYSYSRKILIGLVFCCIGDAFMVWKSKCFTHSVIMFGLGQIMYTSAFGFKPFNIYVAAFVAILNSIIYSHLYEGLKGAMVYCVGVYILLIGVMLWRAVSRVKFFDCFWSWTKLCSCMGAILFTISDLTLGINAFYSPVPYSHQIIMTSYYAAQFAIALSVVDSKVDCPKGANDY